MTQRHDDDCTTTLSAPRVAKLLDALFARAGEIDGAVRRQLGQLPAHEREARMARARDDYRGFYAEARELFLPVSRETGRLLYLLARARRAKGIVEFGTSFGISTIHLAAALRDNGGGRLVGSELEGAKAARARENLAAAGLSDLVEVREGDALESLARDLPEVDLVLLDGAKVLYPRLLALLEPRLAMGALVVADNATDSPEFLAHVREPANGYLSVPFADDVEVSMRVTCPDGGALPGGASDGR
jgi:predicted O-methyltransferase YrrM